MKTSCLMQVLMRAPETPGSGTALLDTEALATAKALQPTREPVPVYDPLFHESWVAPNHPLREQVHEERTKAWANGITREELQNFEHGACFNQLTLQLEELRAWNQSHAGQPGSSAAS